MFDDDETLPIAIPPPTLPDPTDQALSRIRNAMTNIDGRMALVIMGDTETDRARAQFVMKTESGWSALVGGGYDFGKKDPFLEFQIVKVWK